jgi:protein-S-isoprenylcysteine O-methyltransferase Ste14
MNGDPFDVAVSIVVTVSVVAILVAVLADFALYGDRRDVRAEKKSVVATGTMTLFYLGYCVVVWLRVGRVPIDDLVVRRVLAVVGAACVVAGAAVNIAGRLGLRKHWANQIKIYDDHRLITTGVFALVRHPLYASLMLMFLGGALVYANAIAALATAVVFVPFMYLRARQEELLLAAQFDEYAAYRARTGMFLPTVRR